MTDEILNLVPAIRVLEAQIKKLQNDFNKKVKPYENGLAQLRELNMACENCSGEGKVLRKRSCAEDDRPNPDDPTDYVLCPKCKGSKRKSD